MLYAADPSSGSALTTILPFLLLGVIAYLLIFRPQQKRRREALQMQNQLGPGDEVQTVGGLYGTVTSVDDDAVTIEAAPGVELRFVRQAIAKINKQVVEEPVDDATDEESSDEAADGDEDTAKAADKKS